LPAFISQRHKLELKLCYEKKRNKEKRYKEATTTNAERGILKSVLTGE